MRVTVKMFLTFLSKRN